MVAEKRNGGGDNDGIAAVSVRRRADHVSYKVSQRPPEAPAISIIISSRIVFQVLRSSCSAFRGVEPQIADTRACFPLRIHNENSMPDTSWRRITVIGKSTVIFKD